MSLGPWSQYFMIIKIDYVNFSGQGICDHIPMQFLQSHHLVQTSQIAFNTQQILF